MRWAGEASAFGVIERECFAVVEDGQVVVGVASQPDHIAHRQQGAAAGERFAGAGFQLFECGGDDDAGGQPVVLAEFTGGQQGAGGGEQGVVVALSGAAGVALDGGLRRGAADARGLIFRVAHAWCGEFGEDGVEGGACFGGEVAADRGHAVEILVADGEAAPAGPVDVGEVAVGVEAVGEGVSQPAQFVGAVLTGQSGQLGFGFLAGLDIDEIGQSVHEAADDRDVAGADLAVALGLCGGRQQRCQGFTVEGGAFAEIGGFVDAPRGFGAGDPQPVGQRRGQFPAQLGWHRPVG